jgi:hypothetical protein
VNEGTLVVVHCYQGDAHQVEHALPQYLHHECPVLVLSPADSPVRIEDPRVECRAAGKRAYTGQDSLDRQKAHLEILLDYPQSFFLLHDSDSVCLSPELPAYLYENPDTVFYNPAPTARFILQSVGSDEEQRLALKRWPVAYQPPLFLSRASLEKMLEVSDAAMAFCPPWAKLIDWYLGAMVQLAGLRARPLRQALSRPIWAPYEVARTYAMVRTRGTRFLHSVKEPEVLDVLVSGHAEYNRDPDGMELCASW